MHRFTVAAIRRVPRGGGGKSALEIPHSIGFLRNKNAALPARAQKNPWTLSGLKKKWVPDGASGHELSRPKRVSWLPAYGMMWATSILVSCAGVKTHVFMHDSLNLLLFVARNTGREADHLLSISEPIACKDTNLFEAFSCP
jgi:hypothetical protein